MSLEKIQKQQLILVVILKALSDPTRLKIVQELIKDDTNAQRHCSSFLMLKEMSRSTRSHHFKILREAGLISLIDKGNLTLAQLRREEIDKQFPNLLPLLASDNID